jgi:hypothetical protein
MTTSSITHESGWNVSFWFAICSPLIGALLGVLAFDSSAMNLTPIAFILVIFLFGFDSTEQSKPRKNSRVF